MPEKPFTLRRATEADIPLIRQLADAIFPATYRGIISDSQIDYMMEWMYGDESLRRQMSEGHAYFIGEEGGVPFGYVSVERQRPNLFHLQKIYVLPDKQGSGHGRFLFHSAVDYVKTLNPEPSRIELNVNRANPAVGFYRHMGMHIDRQGDFDIGEGYQMNDFIMVLDVNAARKPDPDGLSATEVEASRAHYGANMLTPPARQSLWQLYLDKYRDPIIRILLAAAAVSLVLAFVENDFVETIGIILAIFFATTVGFYFERDAARKFNLLTALDEEQAVKVRRGGKVVEVPRRDVVVGDIVLLDPGDEVPADGILLQAVDLQVDESSLTGEPIAAKDVEPSDAPSTYARNQLLRSSMVMSGRAVFRVTAVGDSTEIGHVARQSTEITSVKTPLNIQLDRLARLISKVGTIVSVAAFVLFLGHDIISNPDSWLQLQWLTMAHTVLKYFMMAVTLIVMAVPEGLPMAVTLALALNMRRMLKSNNLVRKLHACETMGAVTVICTDKTGTLTENRMSVERMVIVDGQRDDLAMAIAVNTTAELDDGRTIGNPTEGALLQWLRREGYDYRQLRADATVSDQQPFSTERKYMRTTTPEHQYIKGAPEVVATFCQMGDDHRQQLADWQQRGMRTLAFAVDGRLQALCAISDPVRKDVPSAVASCRKAGIEVTIVTGDNAATAAEVGRQIGLDISQPEQTIIGADFAAMSDEEALQRAPLVRVMSRARPADKQRLVEMLQRHGEVVAVTGDGTNDAPALHHAHVGLSLGSGTSVAKEASDMTLLDDSFRSVAHAVMWGRSLYRNIQRFLYYQLVVNVTALLLVLAGSFIGTELPLTVTQILWVNLIMDTFAALALASLPPSREVMNEPPRRTDDFIISRPMGQAIMVTSLLFFAVMFVFLVYCERNGGAGINVHELTLFFTTFVMMQWWNLFNAKTLGSRHSAFRLLWRDHGMLLVLALILLGQVGIVTFGGRMFRTESLSFSEWTVLIAITSVVLWVGELIRFIARRKQKA